MLRRAGALTPQRVQLEQAVGFDHGPRVRGADFTLFALLCRDQGARFAWLDAPAEEPAPLTVTAFVEQRRRAMVDRLSVLSEGSSALSVDRRTALLIMTGAQPRARRRPALAAPHTPCHVARSCSLWVMRAALPRRHRAVGAHTPPGVSFGAHGQLRHQLL
jgi:hypothetical protein